LIRNLVAHQKVFDLVRRQRPQRPQHADAVERPAHGRLPLLQQLVERGEQALFRRLPGLHQVTIEPHAIDRGDGGLGVGIGREQHALGLGKERARLFEKLHARHLRHALVDQQERHHLVAALQFAQGVERDRARVGLDQAVVRRVFTPQIALHGVQDLGVVVNG
jgi:hypothetical protein